jgi:hypothetical protein
MQVDKRYYRNVGQRMKEMELPTPRCIRIDGVPVIHVQSGEDEIT